MDNQQLPKFVAFKSGATEYKGRVRYAAEIRSRPAYGIHCTDGTDVVVPVSECRVLTRRNHTVKKTGRTWSVVNESGVIVEGGFFARNAADDACAALNV